MKRIIGTATTGSFLTIGALLLASGCNGAADEPSPPQSDSGSGASDQSASTSRADLGRQAALSTRTASWPKQAHIATDRVLVTLDAVPPALQTKSLTHPAWARWVQERLGKLEVRSVRLLRKARGASLVTAGSTLVVSVAKTTEESIRAVVARAGKRTDMARVEADPLWTLHAAPNDPLYPQQWHLPKIRAPEAWDAVTASADVTVAVLDTGIDVNHQDLMGALWTNPDEVADGVDNDGNGLVDDVRGWNFVSDDDDLTDSTGHGTHVAGLVAATGNNAIGVAGVAFGARVMPLVIADPGVSASAATEAIFYAVDEGAHIINMSFGGPETFVGVREAIDYAVAHGVLLIGSAGNNSSSDYNFPAVLQDVIAVAASDENDVRAGLSNYGHWVDVTAPGLNVLSTLPNDTYGSVSGTSQAAPIVAGVAALVKAAHPTWSPEQIRVQVLAAADNLDPVNSDYAGLLGAGRVDAAEAVGPQIVVPRAFVAGVDSRELSGNGDQEVGAGESASLAVSLHFTAAASGVDARLVSTDPFVTVSSGAVSLDARADRVSVADFTIAVANDVPSDHAAALSVELESPPGTVVASLPISVLLARRFHHLELPWASERVLLPVPAGRQVLVADEFQGLTDRVYAAFRNVDGSFTPPVMLSDTSRNARRAQAVVAPNGDVHVIYYQFVATLDRVAFPGYARYDAALGTWQPGTTLFDGGEMNNRGDDNVALIVDSSGTLHLAWATRTGVATRRWVNGAFNEPVAFAIEGVSNLNLELEFVDGPAGLRLFAHPISAPPIFGQVPNLTLPTRVLTYDGASWTPPVEIANASGDELAQDPFGFGSSTFRFFQPVGSAVVELAELDATAWTGAGPVQDIDGADFLRGFSGLMQGPSSFLTYLARPVATTQGSERLLTEDGNGTLLFGDRKLRATMPFLAKDATGPVHAFNQENELFRLPNVGTFVELAAFTSYYTSAPVASAALPTLPVVVDDGDSTGNDRVLHASWSSTHAAGITSYRVAWGTLPGADDLAPWQETTATEATFDLDDQRLLPGQTAYASVRARSGALLSSDIGVSDGITLEQESLSLQRSP